ncbi:MAG: prepilin peptidase [Caulobacterales bacterium]|nr:prepilin peptidase [Caulobacterales bacterium]
MALITFSLLLIYAAARDVASYTIPNWVSAALAVAFLAFALFVMSPGTLAVHLAVGMAALVLGAACFAFGWIGGGDAKLFAAIALWAGWASAGDFVVWTALAGGVLSLVVIIARSCLSKLEPKSAWAARLLDTRGGVPYGVALAVGGVVAVTVNGPFQVALST